MKTNTKSQLVEFIRQNGSIRPTELVKLLRISPQALHRQLKALVAQGVIEPRGTPPKTQYVLAGVPDFSAAFDWVSVHRIQESPLAFVSETRDVFAARLSPLKALLKQGLAADGLPLLISVIGEIGNNSFDHNLGQWRDVPGCWFETQVTGHLLWVCIADRGQGILHSLTCVDPKITSDQSALQAAFERFISGRAPEQRGNGLKYVKQTILSAAGRGIACASGDGIIQFGDEGGRCAGLLEKNLSSVEGTVTLLVWRLK